MRQRDCSLALEAYQNHTSFADRDVNMNTSPIQASGGAELSATFSSSMARASSSF